MEHVQVFFVDLPGKTGGLTVKNNDDSYTILLNAGHSAEIQRKTYDHEIKHINNKDYDSMYDVNDLEHVRHAV